MKQVEINQIQQLREIAKLLLKQYPAPQCFALNGNLGSGKTTFVKCVIEELNIQDIVTSPTYALVNQYGDNDLNVYHLDLYRLNDAEEAFHIGIEEILEDNGYVFIEWPEIIDEFLPENTINLYFSLINNKRILKYE